jgi:uncharacterized Zn-binding protein involved in type VI secretion
MSRLENLGKKMGIGADPPKPPPPPANPDEPKPPPNPKKELADNVKKATEAAKTVQEVAGVLADPGGALKEFAKSQALKKMDKLIPGFSEKFEKLTSLASPAALEEAFAGLTNNLSAALGPFPGATMTSMALGIPHAHVKHPPSGPPPVPPTPLPPMGPILLGNCVQVLINSKPAARCGDFGLNPTCCGILPPLSAMYEIMTGSSNVYIGGTRAARSGIDITLHCKSGGGGAGKAGKAAGACGKMGKLAKVAKVASKVQSVAGKVASVAGKAAAVGQVAADYTEAEANDDAAMASAVALNAAMTAAQAAADAIAAAMSKQKGTDLPMLPPTGTPGMILNGSANVMIGGLPLPSFAKIAGALSNRVKGLRGKPGGGGGGGGGGAGAPTK